MTKYIFDVTDLRVFLTRTPALSGIQRVVVMAVARAQGRLGKNAVWLGYYDKKRARYMVVLPDPAMDLEQPEHLRAVLNVGLKPQALPAMARYAKRKTRRQLKTWLLDLAARAAFSKPFKPLQMTPEEWLKLRTPGHNLKALAVAPAPIEEVSEAGDQLLLLDNIQKQGELLATLPKLKAHGLAISVLIHDLIALVTPQFSEGETPRRTYSWLQASLAYTTRYIANSRQTARDLQAFLDAHGGKQPVHIVPLAQARLSLPVAAGSLLSDEAAALYPLLAAGLSVRDRIRGLAKMDFVLVVGTLEVRKNLWGLARAWDRLRQDADLALPKLVVAGRPGWLNDDFDALMAGTGNLGGWVEIVEGPTDGELDWLYRHCLFTAMVSYYEGWGLPIGESLGYGKTAIVSRAASMPEVGGDMVQYCDPHDIGSISDACRRLIVDPSCRHDLETRIQNAQLRNWDDVASDLIDAVR